MKRVFVAAAAVLLLAISAFGQTGKLEIRLKNNDLREQQTKQQLERLLAAYDLSRWMFTRTILIDGGGGVIPHSHPVLTLHTRHLKDDELLLSTFVHEQLHWFLVQRDKETDLALKEVRVMFPKVPVGYPEGANDVESTYLHLLVNSLEYMADRELLGELRTKQVMEFWSEDHYTWIYKTVLERGRDIAKILFKYKLTPPRV